MMKFESTKMSIFKHTLVIILAMVFAFVNIGFFVKDTQALPIKVNPTDYLEFDGEYDWETNLDVQTSSSLYMSYSEFRDNYCLAATSASACASAANGKMIRFDDAEELYRFSVDVSFEQIYITGNPTEDVKLSDTKIDVLLSLDYVLGQDIDYSVMQSKAFIPVGYIFTDVEENLYQRYFTGSFDGQGFEIKNLYLAGYEFLVFEDQVDLVTTVDIAMSEYYAMFNYNAGTVKNFGVSDANLEILELHPDITKLANIVGYNLPSGQVEHIYVIDNRTSVTQAGIRYQVGTASEDFQAAGLVHTNYGSFTDSYYVSKVVVNGNFINKFDVQPVLFDNFGTVSNLYYDSDKYLLTVTVGTSTFLIDTPNAYATGESTSLLKSESSGLNQGVDNWYFYPDDGYPILQGLTYDAVNDVYEIDEATDLAFFSEMLSFITLKNSVPFNESDYVLKNTIDMSVLAEGIYQVPSKIFYGSFSGYNSAATDLNENYYIHDMVIEKPVSVNSEYFSGLFSRLGTGAVVENLNFSQSDVKFLTTETIYSYNFYLGAIAGKMTGATIENVLVDVDLDLGTEAIGRTYLGNIVGSASGVIKRVSASGEIDFGTHSYLSTYNINPKFYIGGIVGSTQTAKLTIDEAINTSDIYGFSTSSDIVLASGSTAINVYIGGVIGYINNTAVAMHEMVAVSNKGDIYVQSVKERTVVQAYQYVGGVFGLLEGLAPVLEEDSEYKFANLYNEGNISHSYLVNTADVISAGIGVSQTNEAVEYALLFNHGNFSFNEGAATYTQTQFKYAATIYDISSSNVTLSRVYNYGDITYDSNIYGNISNFMYSANNNPILIRFSANYGDLNFMNNGGATQISMSTSLNIAMMTLNTNVSFLNVHNYGDISVVNVSMGGNTVYISGFTKTLAANKVLKNSLNSGDIVFAQMSGTGNIYIGGFVNTNNSGDLHLGSQSPTQPIANYGIIDVINNGNISTTYSPSLYGINGTANTFVGGIATLNKGSIQDAANLGDIALFNTSTSGVSNFQNDAEQYFAGLVSSYTAGIVAGGVSAIVLDGNSRIYDSSNNGDVLVKAYRFARAGGVLGVSLYQEAIAGGITSGMGLVDSIQNSVLSNGLNFGDISAITAVIGTYSNTTVNNSFSLFVGEPPAATIGFSNTTTQASEDRPPIYAAAGGVIGYGLSYMQNMLNHGTISSTDVAGGVVGATYVLGGSTSPTTVVNITTAVNYGLIKSVLASNYSSINGVTFTVNNLSPYYMSDGNTFIFPTDYTRESPRAKRGFGGIFGRLQRGVNGVMTAEGGSFDFIVNANPEIDLIGRLDQVQNFSSSGRYFRFNDAIYYSAKENDTTQVVFTGFYYSEGGVVSNIQYLGYTRERFWFWYYYYFTYRITVSVDTLYFQQGVQNESAVLDPTTSTFDEVIEQFNNSTPPGSNYFVGQSVPSAGGYVRGKEVPWITEDPNDPLITDSDSQFIYDAAFPMRTNPDLTEYIYFAEYDLLADRFKVGGTNPRPYGMYVLSTTAGRDFGSVLPRNIRTSLIELINEDLTSFISLVDTDYSNIAPSISKDLDAGILTNYDALFQTIYNDKAELIDSSLQNLVLTEDGGSQSVLSLANIDYANKTIYYTISMEAFGPLQTSASFNVYDAWTSANSLVAVRAEDYFGLDDLIISEYVEGTDGNISNAIELYNGTGESVDLSTYSIRIYRSGSATPNTTINLSGTLASGDTYVLVNSAAPQSMLDLADLVTVMQYNGDDAIALVDGSTLVDVFGVIGQDPGTAWTWSGGGSSMSRTLVRSSATTSPTTSWDTSEWIIYPGDTRDYIGQHNVYLEALSGFLYPERFNEISTAYPADLSVDLPSYSITSNVTLPLGYFSVFSEAFVGDPNFADRNYYNDYQVFVTFTPNGTQSPGTIGIVSAEFNGGAAANVVDPADIRGLGDVNYNGSLTLNFEDTKGILVDGYDFSNYFTLKYNDGTTVHPDYYTVSSSPVDIISGTGYYSITFEFSGETKSGDYYIEYKYFSSSTLNTIYFDKGASSLKEIFDLDYYSMDDSLVINGLNITSYVNMGTVLNIDTSTDNFTENIIGGVPSYLSNMSYDISYMSLGSLEISEFASITSARLVSFSYTDGYKTYILEYIVEAEDGTQNIYTHNIIERTVDLESVLRDGNDMPLGNISTTREAENTVFTVDLGFDQNLELYTLDPLDDSYLEISVSGTTLDGLTSYLPAEIVGLSYLANDYLIINMSFDTLPGIYTFTIRYYRDGSPTDFITIQTALVITKNAGIDAYLDDIKFSELANETSYPNMDVTDVDGNVISSPYDPAIYFDGIDYDDIDLINYPYFRIDGKVSNTPLDSYTPYFLDYLPLGATISRRAWDPVLEEWYYTPDVNNDSDPADIAELATDFTLIPETGAEPIPPEEVVIQYRVTSEDGLNQVYYYITVTDVIFNLTIVFDIYFCTDATEGSCVLAKDSVDFNDELVIINVQNILTDGDDTVFGVTDPDDYPAFTEVTGLKNRMTQFYYTNNAVYTYRFGRNTAGFYTFDVELPLDQYLNDIYTYEIEFAEYYLNDASDYVPGLQGKYFYIEYAISNRTRRFNIYIREIENPETNAPFGLFEFFKSWGG